jgi:hypothetical protein
MATITNNSDHVKIDYTNSQIERIPKGQVMTRYDTNGIYLETVDGLQSRLLFKDASQVTTITDNVGTSPTGVPFATLSELDSVIAPYFFA